MIMNTQIGVDLNDWYWIVGKDTSKVFSSATARFVPAGDANYARWQEAGRHATHIASEDELVEAFATSLPNIVPRIPRALLAYSARVRAAKEREQWSFEGNAISPAWSEQLLIALAHNAALETIPLVLADGTTIEASVKALSDALLDRLFELAAVQATLAAGITSTKITEPQQIDDAYAAVK